MYIKISCDNICNIGKYSDEALYMRTPVQLKYISHYFRGSVITGLRHQQTEYLVRVPGLLMSGIFVCLYITESKGFPWASFIGSQL